MENTKVTVTLTVQEWNVVLNAIGTRPFAEVHALITEINNQAIPQIKKSEEVSTEN